MLNITLNEATGIILLEPEGKLEKEDFEKAAAIIDPYIEKEGKFNGVMIHTRSFPGWDSFGTMIKHLSFVKEHQKYIERVAVATDSSLGTFMESIAGRFVNAAVKKFPYDKIAEAEKWLSGK